MPFHTIILFKEAKLLDSLYKSNVERAASDVVDNWPEAFWANGNNKFCAISQILLSQIWAQQANPILSSAPSVPQAAPPTPALATPHFGKNISTVGLRLPVGLRILSHHLFCWMCTCSIYRCNKRKQELKLECGPITRRRASAAAGGPHM